MRNAAFWIEEKGCQPTSVRIAKAGDCQSKDLPEAALGANTEVLENEPDADLILRVGKAESAGSQAPDKVPCKHALRLGAADGHALSHVAKLMVIDTWMTVGLRNELGKALQLWPELLRVILVRWLIAGPIGRYKSCWRLYRWSA